MPYMHKPRAARPAPYTAESRKSKPTSQELRERVLLQQVMELQQRRSVASPPAPNAETDTYAATGSSESTLLAGWMAAQGVSSEISRIGQGGTLWVIGHDYEIRDGFPAIRELYRLGFESSKTGQVVLIVCSSADMGRFGMVPSVAQNFATHLKVPVYGSSVPVGMSCEMSMMFVDGEPEGEAFRRAGAMTRSMLLDGDFYRFTPMSHGLFMPH